MNETKPNKLNGVYYYRPIDEIDVDVRVRIAARQMLEFCKRDLNLPNLRIQWVIPDSMPEVSRVFELLDKLAMRRTNVVKSDAPLTGQIAWIWGNGVIAVSADQTPEQIALTVAHEAKHVADSMIYRPPRTSGETFTSEQRAAFYESYAARQLNMATS